MEIKKVKEKVIVLPNIFKFIKDQVKDNFDEHGQEILADSTGLAGILVKLFAKDAIDKYFQIKENEKLKDDGLVSLLEASFAQVTKSINYIKDGLPDSNSIDLLEHYLSTILFNYENDFLNDKIESLEKSYNIHYLHSYPPIAFARDTVEEILRELDLNIDTIDEFVKHFNKNIKETIFETFTEEEFNKLSEIIEKNQLEDSVLQLLQDMERLNRIGFASSENLNYMPTYAKWKEVNQYGVNESIDDKNYDEVKELENELSIVETLIEDYFSTYKVNDTIKKILFIIADFGKGKSTFLKQYASSLASNYLRRGDSEPFPIYFNLKHFLNRNYDPNHPLGIIGSYLSVDYGINLNSGNFKSKKFILLLDSLDESGDLDKKSIENVIRSIKKIQKLDTQLCRENRILITSRPIGDALSTHLNDHEPYIRDNIEYFISLHGFKSSQLNEWIKLSLNNSDVDISSLSGFSKEIMRKTKDDEDLYQFILDKNLLKHSELQRPIFSYMMYKLILSNIDFSEIEKIGIYLSFLNILTKDAKHTGDLNYKVHLADEFNFRNILHYIAVLWLKQRDINDSSMLRRKDICRTIKGKIPDDESKVNCESISDLKFLSHSYFGNDGDTLYFNHQSFAEMLLAEYYLKVFIKYALDSKDDDVEDVRILLSIGTPTW